MSITYIAGPMTGIDKFNRPAFDGAAKRLREPGGIVINPADNFGGDQTLQHDQYMRYSIHQLLVATDIYMLKGWMDSAGARVEYEVAMSLGLAVHFE